MHTTVFLFSFRDRRVMGVVWTAIVCGRLCISAHATQLTEADAVAERSHRTTALCEKIMIWRGLSLLPLLHGTKLPRAAGVDVRFDRPILHRRISLHSISDAHVHMVYV